MFDQKTRLTFSYHKGSAGWYVQSSFLETPATGCFFSCWHVLISVPRAALRKSWGLFFYSEPSGKGGGFCLDLHCAVQCGGFMVTWNMLSSKPSGCSRGLGEDNLRHHLTAGMLFSAEVACRLCARLQSHRHAQVRWHTPTGQIPCPPLHMAPTLLLSKGCSSTFLSSCCGD